MNEEYKQIKNDIEETLNSKVEIEEIDSIPNDSAFSYENGVRTWVGSVFVDMISSTKLFKSPSISKNVISRISRAFVEHIVSIMNENENHYEIGIRGDCVYGIFTAEYKTSILSMFRTAYKINTFLKLFNKILSKKGLPYVGAGIGIGVGKDLVVKAGKKRIVHDKIWIGDAVVNASNLSKIANRNGLEPICMDETTYDNIIGLLTNENSNYRNWIAKGSSPKYRGLFYQCNIVQTDFNNWIESGMK